MSNCENCLHHSIIEKKHFCSVNGCVLSKRDFENKKQCLCFLSNKEKIEKLPDTQEKIDSLTNALADLLKYKNKNYGDSALNGVKVFSKCCPTSSICIRLDDKLARISNADKLRTNDVCDVMGYLVLLAIEMGMTAEDIEKLKD